jgi:uncharacterized membrane protein
LSSLGRWRFPSYALGLIGVVDSAYLLLNSIFPSVQLVCPSSGAINCGEVTSSPFSHILGVPVALPALAWFLVLIVLIRWNPHFNEYALLPIWVAGIVTVGYLISAEVFFIHAICLYCTLAHACALLLGIPVTRLTFRD